MNENNHFLPYLIPGTNDATEKHEEVAHGDQAGPDHQGEEAQQLLKHWLDANQDKDAEEDGQRRGNGNHEGDVSLDVLPRGGEEEKKQPGLSWEVSKGKQDTKCRIISALVSRVIIYEGYDTWACRAIV